LSECVLFFIFAASFDLTASFDLAASFDLVYCLVLLLFGLRALNRKDGIPQGYKNSKFHRFVVSCVDMCARVCADVGVWCGVRVCSVFMHTMSCVNNNRVIRDFMIQGGDFVKVRRQGGVGH
tara:strand:+ start:183 stop:548 length:366 start_codon:yes stop_codon:yes gene_type:complete